MGPKPIKKICCTIDLEILKSLIISSAALNGETVEREGLLEGEEESVDYNTVLTHILLSMQNVVNKIAAGGGQVQDSYQGGGEREEELKTRIVSLEDETDEAKQRALKGNLIVCSQNINGKGSLLKSDEDLKREGVSLTDHLIDLVAGKYGVVLPQEDIQACHRLPNNGVILRIWNRKANSAWARIVEGVKSGANQGMNVYFNFHLTKRRARLLYEVRKMKKNGSLSKFYTDENGQITVKKTEAAAKVKITYFSKTKNGPKHTFSLNDLSDLV